MIQCLSNHEAPKLYARGVCYNCYCRFLTQINRGKTTWQQLILEGKVLAKTTEGREETTPLARTLRHYRTKTSISGRELAKFVGVGKTCYYDWEDSKTSTMSLDEVLSFCNALSIDPKDFITTYICNRDE